VEHTTQPETSRVAFATTPPKPGQSILPQGREMKRGDTVLNAGTVLGPAQIGLLATVGCAAVKLVPQPTVAILATGDELVEAEHTPGPGQLRNSNGPMLVAQAQRAGAISKYLGIAPDRLDVLRSRISEGLRANVLVLSGGVSMGKLDLVPGVLQGLGVQSHFHQVAMKPGKPLFFGTRDDTLVFGLPGNPVSTFCCFELFVRPAVRSLAGNAKPGPTWQQARLHEEFTYRTDRPTYHPAKLDNVDGVNLVQRVAWFGSPDLRALAQANALMVLPAGDHSYAAGTMMPVLPLD
jgi:molybdopterin molybdotransferase